jgi:hypothetical protein
MGDCMSACIASIFGLDLDEVPHFVERNRLFPLKEGSRADTELTQWAASFGVCFNRTFYKTYRAKPQHFHPGYWIASVKSCYEHPKDGNTYTHAVVMWGDDVKHDPNPVSREYHAKHAYRFRGEIWFELYDPATFVRCLDYHVIHELMVFAA